MVYCGQAFHTSDLESIRYPTLRMKELAIIFLIFFSGSSYGQNCATLKNGALRTEVLIPTTSIEPKSSGSPKGFITGISLCFAGSFNDTAIILLNNIQIYKGFFGADVSHDNEHTEMQLPIDKNIKTNILQIELMLHNECMSAQINDRYKFIQVYRGNSWKINFTNYSSLIAKREHN